MEFGCGQCLPCRINRARVWQTRLVLEWYKHPASVFVTLTYQKEPPGRALVKKDLQDFFKRLRFAVSPRKFRYFAVGEYGDRTNRPHYHAILFGLSIFDQDTILRQWGLGFVQVSEFTEARAGYIVGYVTKKLTKEDLVGRPKEFQLQSRNPPVGGQAIIDNFPGVVHHRGGANYVARHADVPATVRIEGYERPIGRTLRDRLRKETGYDGEKEKEDRRRKFWAARYAESHTVGVTALEARREAKARAVEGKFRARGKTRVV